MSGAALGLLILVCLVEEHRLWVCTAEWPHRVCHRTPAPCIGSVESQPLDHKGSLSSKNFTALGLMFRSLIRLELFFVSCKSVSDFIHVDVRCAQHCWLKKAVLSRLSGGGPCL